MYRLQSSSVLVRRYIPAAVVGIFCLFVLFFYFDPRPEYSTLHEPPQPSPEQLSAAAKLAEPFETEAKYFVDYPLNNSAWGQLGQRTQILTEWLQKTAIIEKEVMAEQYDDLMTKIEDAIVAHYPFIANPKSPSKHRQLTALRNTFVPGSKGIVLVVGKGQFRYATHLITNIRDLLHSTLPIQIAHCGDDDLPKIYRDALISMGPNIEELNVIDILDDHTLDLKNGGWAIKPFAALASTFEQVLLMDADDVFVQKPEIIFEEHSGYRETGTLLFHDRLVWKDIYKERRQFWEEIMKFHTPSPMLEKSRVWKEKFAEEGDSGLVALDKSRLPILMALLHISWQNSKSVRDEYTYRLMYGDKESYWLGLELCSVPYAFEEYYGACLGEILKEENGSEKVCSFTIAHVGEHDRLFWYNGSLLKNKKVDPNDFAIPEGWMIGSHWWKGADRSQPSCMTGGSVKRVDEDVLSIIKRSVENAKKLDEKYKDLIASA